MINGKVGQIHSASHYIILTLEHCITQLIKVYLPLGLHVRPNNVQFLLDELSSVGSSLRHLRIPLGHWISDIDR